MMLKRKRVLDVVIDVLHEIQETIVDDPETIGEDTVPIGDLCEFDSLASVEATVYIFNSLGLSEPSCPSIFINKNNKALSIGQVVDCIIKLGTKRK